MFGMVLLICILLVSFPPSVYSRILQEEREHVAEAPTLSKPVPSEVNHMHTEFPHHSPPVHDEKQTAPAKTNVEIHGGSEDDEEMSFHEDYAKPKTHPPHSH